MKKIITILFTILAFTLTACGASTSTGAVSSPQVGTSRQTLEGVNLILLGTFKLDGTEQAVTPEQAKELLPLWQVYQEISTSSTAAQAEIDALEKQIEETMTSAQMQTINAMNLTSQDTFTVMQDRGIQMGMGGTSTSRRSGTTNFVPGMGGGGGAPPDMSGGAPMGGGSVTGGGQMPVDGQGFNPDQTTDATGTQANRGNFMTSALINALIQYLQELAAT
jgi:hypothetical protein